MRDTRSTSRRDTRSSTLNKRRDPRSTLNKRRDPRSTLNKRHDSRSTLNKRRVSSVPRCNQYHVVAFIVLPSPEIDEYVCVPHSWLIKYDEESTRADVAYPKGNLAYINRLARKNKSDAKCWKTYQAFVKHSSDCFDKATNEMRRMLQEKATAPLSIREPTNQSSPPKDLSDPERNKPQLTVTTSNDRSFFRNNGAQKRCSPVDLNREASIKLTRTENMMEDAAETAKRPESNQRCSELDDRLNERSAVSTTLEGLYEEVTKDTDSRTLTGDNSLQGVLQASGDHSTITAEYDFSLMKFITQFRDAMERFQRFAHIAKNITNDVDEFYEFAALITDYRESLTASELNKATKTDGLNAEIGDEVLSIKDDSDDISEAPKNKTVMFTLPHDYDPNDSKWTLRYRNPGPGLRELLPSSGIYVNAARLDECRSLATDCGFLAQLLFVEVFSDSALKVCSLTGARSNLVNFDCTETSVRPGLHEVARAVILRYVEIYGREEGLLFDYQYIVDRMRGELYRCRNKSRNNV